MALQSLSKNLGWSVLSSSAHLGVGTCENLGNAAGCLLSSPSGKRLLAVRSSPQTYHGGLQVFVGYPPGAAIDLANQPPSSSQTTTTKTTRKQQPQQQLFGSMPMDVDGSSGTSNTHPFDVDSFDTDETFVSTTGIEYKPIRLEKLEGKNLSVKFFSLIFSMTSVTPLSEAE